MRMRPPLSIVSIFLLFQCLDGKANLPLVINAQNLDLHLLVLRKEIMHVFDVNICHLRDMDQADFLLGELDKSTEIRDACDDALHYAAYFNGQIQSSSLWAPRVMIGTRTLNNICRLLAGGRIGELAMTRHAEFLARDLLDVRGIAERGLLLLELLVLLLGSAAAWFSAS